MMIEQTNVRQCDPSGEDPTCCDSVDIIDFSVREFPREYMWLTRSG
jgi:hypothetical protein